MSTSSFGREINQISGLLGDANLQGYWRMESGALVTDSGPNNYNLTNNNTVTEGTGKFGGAGDFERDTDESLTIVDASCPNLEISGSQTWSCWFKMETGAVNVTLVGKFTSGALKRLHINNASPNRPRFQLSGLTTNSAVESGVALSTGVWYHICGVYDSGASKIKIFVNGVKTELTASGTATDTNGAFAIGDLGDQGTNSFTDGVLDDVAIWNRALSDAEVVTMYSAKLGEDIALSDTLDRELTIVKTLDDALAISDTLDGQIVIIVNLSDTVGITDSLEFTKVITSVLQDSIGLTDTLVRQVDFSRALAESLALTDTLSYETFITLALQDSLALSESLGYVLRTIDSPFIKVIIVDDEIDDAPKFGDIGGGNDVPKFDDGKSDIIKMDSIE